MNILRCTELGYPVGHKDICNIDVSFVTLMFAAFLVTIPLK